MKKFMLVAAMIAVSGCATVDRSQSLTTSEKRKQSLKDCVKEMLHEDVTPADGLKICSKVYERRSNTIGVE